MFKEISSEVEHAENIQTTVLRQLLHWHHFRSLEEQHSCCLPYNSLKKNYATGLNKTKSLNLRS